MFHYYIVWYFTNTNNASIPNIIKKLHIQISLALPISSPMFFSVLTTLSFFANLEFCVSISPFSYGHHAFKSTTKSPWEPPLSTTPLPPPPSTPLLPKPQQPHPPLAPLL